MTTELGPGANTYLEAEDVDFTVTIAAGGGQVAVIAAALGDGRSQDNLASSVVPTALAGALQWSEQPGGVGFRIHLAAIPADVTAVKFIAVAPQGAPARPQGFAVGVRGGPPTAAHAVSGAVVESAVILGEVYRHQGRWKVRAVSQGYAAGWNDAVRALGLPASAGSHLVFPGGQPAASSPPAAPAYPPAAPAPAYPAAAPAPAYPPPAQAPPPAAYPPPGQAPPPVAQAAPGAGQFRRLGHDMVLVFSTRMPVGPIAQTFRQVISQSSRKAMFGDVQQVENSFDQFEDLADFAAAATAAEWTKMWALQIYIHDRQSHREVTLLALGTSARIHHRRLTA